MRKCKENQGCNVANDGVCMQMCGLPEETFDNVFMIDKWLEKSGDDLTETEIASALDLRAATIAIAVKEASTPPPIQLVQDNKSGTTTSYSPPKPQGFLPYSGKPYVAKPRNITASIRTRRNYHPREVIVDEPQDNSRLLG